MDAAAGARPYGVALQPAVAALATDALAVGIGGTLPTNKHYLATKGIGAGTLQRALKELRAGEAVEVVSRGHMGRVVTDLDIAAVWRAAWLPPVRMVLPPAGPVEITELQQVVAEALTELGIPHTVQHLRGGSARLAMAAAGEADLVVVSAGTLAADRDPFQHRALGLGTYYGPDRIAVVRRRGDHEPPRRVAVDPDSPDHRAITEGEFPPGGRYEYVTVPFPRVPAAVLSHQADIGIWHITPSVVPLDLAGLILAQLAEPAGIAAWQQASEAVVVASQRRTELAAVMAGLDVATLVERQAAAIAGDSGLVPT
ncbi:MAG: YhfZ family protein [Propioniciclava sp.]